MDSSTSTPKRRATNSRVLDTKAVTRVDDATFRVTTGVQQLPLFGAFEAVGFVQIRVLPDGVEQRLARAELVPRKPSRVLDEVNATVQALQLTNVVTAEESPSGGKQLVCQARAAPRRERCAPRATRSRPVSRGVGAAGAVSTHACRAQLARR